MRTLRERFDEKWMAEPMSGCWLWVGATDPLGYAYIVDGKMKKAHRVSWELHHGPIPPGMCVCHSCDVPSCVNPGHLWLGTHDDNMHDKASKGRARTGDRRGVAAKLKVEQVIDARRRVRTGETQRSVAADLGVNWRTVNLIVLGHNWSHVPVDL